MTDTKKNIVVAYVLLIFTGLFGGHRFYAGKKRSAVAMLILVLTMFVGGAMEMAGIVAISTLVLVIWWIFDLFLLPSLLGREIKKTVRRRNFTWAYLAGAFVIILAFALTLGKYNENEATTQSPAEVEAHAKAQAEKVEARAKAKAEAIAKAKAEAIAKAVAEGKAKAIADAKAKAKAKAKAEAKEKAKAEAKEKAKAKEAACRSSADCWSKKSRSTAWVYCSATIEQYAKYEYKWSESFSGRFPWVSWANQAAGIITFKGNFVKFQNGFGAFQKVTYECDWNQNAKSVHAVRIY